MGHQKKQLQSDEPTGAPEWMVTFSDCMTLLLTFFVLLLSFSSFDDKVFHRLKIIFCDALPVASPQEKPSKDALLEMMHVMPTEELDKGSEHPTLAKELEGYLKEDKEPVDFHNRKVFLKPSKEVFWGKGTAISYQGRKTLASMAALLKEIPSRIVISENGRNSEQDNKQLGLQRAWAVMEYLTTKQGLDKKWFSITATSTLAEIHPQKSSRGSLSEQENNQAQRILEIVLLERSIYN